MCGRNSFVHGHQLLKHTPQLGGLQGIGPIRLGILWVIVDFHEHSVYPGCDCGTGQHWNELRLPAANGGLISISRGCGGQLHRMRRIKNHWCKLAHDSQRSHVHNQIVVPKAGAALGNEYPVISCLAALLDRMFHVPGRNELAFLDIHCALAHGGRDK